MLSRAHAQSFWQNIKADLLYMSAAYLITSLFEVVQSPSNTQSGANTTATPSPMKMIMKMMTKTWKRHTYRAFSLQIP